MRGIRIRYRQVAACVMPAGFAPYSVLIIFLDKRTRIVKMDTTATHTNREEWV